MLRRNWPRWGSYVLGVVMLGAALADPLARSAAAQSEGVAIESSVAITRERAVLARVEELRKAKKLIGRKRAAELLAKPKPEVIQLPTPRTEPISPRAVYGAARAAYVRVGWYGRLSNEWILDVAGGYVIADGGVVATCRHVLEYAPDVVDGSLVATDLQGRAYAVTSILAASERMDAALIRVRGLEAPPLPLNDDVTPGDRAFIYSDPLEVRGYFSDGIVNRFYWLPRSSGDIGSLRGVASLRMHVSTDWAPGSSGAAVLDESGNAIGHVSSIELLGTPATEGSSQAVSLPTMMALHEAVPARAVRMLAEDASRRAAARSDD